MKRTLVVLPGLAVAAFTLAMIAQPHASPKPEPAPVTAPDPGVVAKLQEIVAIRERQVKYHQLLLDSGRASVESAPDVDLAEARLRLARELRQGEGVIAELKNLVEAHERRVKRIESLSREWRSANVDSARVDLLDAEIRLLKEQPQGAQIGIPSLEPMP